MRETSLPVLMLLVLLSPLAIDIYLPSMPVMAREFSITDSQIQSTLAVFLFAMGLGQILIGPLADRFGRKPVALFGVFLYGLSSLLAAAAFEFHLLLLARVLQGLAACSTSVVAFSAVRDCFTSRQSARIYSYLNGAICVIPALAPSLGGLLAMQFGWRSNFILMTVFAVVILITVSLRFSETKPEETVSHGRLYHPQRFLPVLKEAHFLFYAVSCMSAMAAILCYVSYSPVWLIGHLGISELSFSLLFGFNALINIIACFTAPAINKKLGGHVTVKLAFSLFLTTALLTELLQKPALSDLIGPEYAFMTPMILLCCGFALLLGPATSMALAAFGGRAGTATALLGFIQMSGAALICGLIQQTSLSAPDAIALACFVVPAALLVIMHQPKLSHWHRVN